jgi:nucleotide-binding universal stress UspA family protein
MVNLEMLWWARRAALPPSSRRAAGRRDDGGDAARAPGGAGPHRPVMLATLRGAPVAAAAADLALDLARELDAPLVVADIADAPATRTRRVDLGLPAEARAALRAPAERAAAHGAPATVLHLRAARPVDALVALVAERDPSIVLFGADPARLSRRHLSSRAYRRAVTALAARTTCLLWRVTSASPDAGAHRRLRVPVQP